MNTIAVTSPVAEIDINNHVDYQGTRVQLEAEGLIPVGTVWPDRGQRLEWTSKGFRF